MNQEPTLKMVLADIRKGKIAPCYLLYGDEDYLIKDALHQVVDALIPEADRDMNILYMDEEKEDAIHLSQALLTPPLIPGRKVVVLRNSRLLYSRQSLSEMVRKIKDNLESDPTRAIKSFLAFVRTAGWTIDDLRDGNWKHIPEEEWRRITGEETGEREKWLPKIINLCSSSDFKHEQATDEEQIVGVLWEGLPESNSLVVTADIVDKRKKLFKVMAEKGAILGFHQIRGEAKQKNRMFDAAKGFLRERGKDIEPKALLSLGMKTGFDLRSTMAELEKLIVYAGEKPLIAEEDVENIIGESGESTLFDLTSLLVARDLSGALFTLHRLLDQGIHHLAITAMVIREFRLLLHAKAVIESGRLANFDRTTDFSRFQRTVLPLLKDSPGGSGKRLELLGQHPYVIFNALRFSEKFSMDDLINILEYLAGVDYSLKSSGPNPRLVLERLAVQICHNEKTK